MRYQITFLICLICTQFVSAEEVDERLIPQRNLTTDDITKISEAFGHLIGRSLDNPGLRFEMDAVIKGMRDSAAGKEPPISETEYEDIMALVQENAFYEIADTNLEEANRFMKENRKDSDVHDTIPGLVQVKVIQAGEGREVQPHACPIIRYTGSYLDGQVFGSSEDSGGPITIPLDQTIPGFAKGLVGMKEGERRRIFVHPNMGYGISGHLPPNSLLTFDVELVIADAYLAKMTEQAAGTLGSGQEPMPSPAASGAKPATNMAGHSSQQTKTYTGNVAATPTTTPTKCKTDVADTPSSVSLNAR